MKPFVATPRRFQQPVHADVEAAIAMEPDSYDYRIEVSPAASIAGGRYGFVASVVDLCRRRADGTTESFATPFGQYHGETAAEAEARAREGVERWIEVQRDR